MVVVPIWIWSPSFSIRRSVSSPLMRVPFALWRSWIQSSGPILATMACFRETPSSWSRSVASAARPMIVCASSIRYIRPSPSPARTMKYGCSALPFLKRPMSNLPTCVATESSNSPAGSFLSSSGGAEADMARSQDCPSCCLGQALRSIRVGLPFPRPPDVVLRTETTESAESAKGACVLLERFGGADGTRTRGLRRDRPAL